jgi:hypothetical protein
MATCPSCRQPATTRDGFDRRGRQRFACHPCHRDFTHASSGAFSGYRWPPEVIVTAVRCCLSYALSARQVTELLAERGIDVSARTRAHLDPKPSVQNSRPRLGGIVVGLAAVRLRRPVSDSWKGSRRCRPCDEGMSLCGVWCLGTDLSSPLAATVRGPSPLLWSPWQQG